VLGRAVLQFIRILGPRRALLHVGTAFRNGNNYLQATTRELSSTAVEVELGPLVGPTGYFEGILEAGPALLGAREVRVVQRGRAGEHVTFRVDWKE
jgi:uncharacterized protein (TIGR02265 family)